jgi:hypothetical protein
MPTRPTLHAFLLAALAVSACAALAACSDSGSGTPPAAGDAGAAGAGAGVGAGAGGTGEAGSPGAGGAGNSGVAGAGGTTGTAGAAGAPPVLGDVPQIAGCPVFTADDAWNTDISQKPADGKWTTNLSTVVGAKKLHPDFGSYSGETYGIPINVVGPDQATSTVDFDYADESDPGPYPFPDPSVVKIEGGTATACDGDCHLLVVQTGVCKVFEGYACSHDGGWKCGSGAIFDLTKNSYGQRKKGWTSADAAGLSITAGLLRYDEVAQDALHHAIRMTLRCTADAFVTPASHKAVPGGCKDVADIALPMGARVRLRADYDLSGVNKTAKTILQAMKTYGLIVADNGSDFYFQGEADPRWTEDIEALKAVPSSAFEVVEMPPLETTSN